MNKSIHLKLSKNQVTTSSVIFILLLLLAGLIFESSFVAFLTVAALVLALFLPNIYYPFAIFWISLSNLLGKTISAMILTIIFVILVIPVAVFRKWAGKDTLRLRQFGKSNHSVFIERNHLFTGEDLKNPF